MSRLRTLGRRLRGDRVESSGSDDCRPEDAPFLRWKRMGAAGLAEHPDLLGELLAGDLDGATIPGVLPAATVSRFEATLGELAGHAFEIPEGRTAPHPLFSVTDDHGPYLDAADAAAPVFDRAVGESAAGLLDNLFSSVSGGLPVTVAAYGGRNYAAGNLRWFPAESGLRAHTGNLFLDHNRETAMRELVTDLDVEDSLSWFFIITPPERGGGLRLFDLRWPTMPPQAEGTHWYADDSGLEELDAAVVPPVAGELQVFRGGDIWHRVDEVGGGHDRVSFGGFMARTSAQDGYRYWG